MNEEEQRVWDGFFGTVVGWSQHPGYYRENATKPNLEECADIADQMMDIRHRRSGRSVG